MTAKKGWGWILSLAFTWRPPAFVSSVVFLRVPSAVEHSVSSLDFFFFITLEPRVE